MAHSIVRYVSDVTDVTSSCLDNVFAHTHTAIATSNAAHSHGLTFATSTQGQSAAQP